MTDAVLISAITSSATLVGVLINSVTTWHLKQDVAVVKGVVHEVKKQTNALTTELVTSTAKASKAEGVEAERTRAQMEAGAIAIAESKNKP